MLNYEEFKIIVEKEFANYLPEGLKNFIITTVDKINVTLDGLSAYNPGQKVSPVIYINDMYRHYRGCADINTVFTSAASFLEKHVKDESTINYFSQISIDDTVKDKIVFQLINTEYNKERLAGLPHRQFHDLSIIYRIVFDTNNGGIYSTTINNDIAKRLNMSEQELYDLAYINTCTILPVNVESMYDAMCNIYGDDMLPEELSADSFGMWVISNNMRINGAASILYKDNLYKLSEKIGYDLYILPSSIHEFIVMPAYEDGNPSELADNVADTNSSSVDICDKLSDNVYYYDRVLNSIFLLDTSSSMFNRSYYVISRDDAKMLWEDESKVFCVLNEKDGSRISSCNFESWEEIIETYPDALFGIPKKKLKMIINN